MIFVVDLGHEDFPPVDARYDRGSNFRVISFLDNGAP